MRWMLVSSHRQGRLERRRRTETFSLYKSFDFGSFKMQHFLVVIDIMDLQFLYHAVSCLQRLQPDCMSQLLMDDISFESFNDRLRAKRFARLPCIIFSQHLELFLTYHIITIACLRHILSQNFFPNLLNKIYQKYK